MPGPITAEEFIKKLARDPEYQGRMKEIERRKREASSIYKRAAKGVIKDLAKAGFKVDYVGALYNNKIWYEQAIPVLIKWLSVVENRRVKEDIVRALSVKWAKPQAAPLLIQEYDKLTQPEDWAIRWAIGNALSVVADDRVCDDIMRLAQDRYYGTERQMLAVALGNMRDERVVDVLIDLLKDDDVAGHAIMALRKLRAKRTRPYIEPFLEHERTWVRREAKKALAIFDK